MYTYGVWYRVGEGGGLLEHRRGAVGFFGSVYVTCPGGQGGSRLQAITVGPAGGELESMIVHSRHNTNNTMELEAATKGGNKRVEF